MALTASEALRLAIPAPSRSVVLIRLNATGKPTRSRANGAAPRRFDTLADAVAWVSRCRADQNRPSLRFAVDGIEI